MAACDFLSVMLVLLGGVLPARSCAKRAALERGTAIIDPAGLARTRSRKVRPRPHADAGAIGRCAAHQRRSCSRCRRWLPVRKALDAEFDRYIARHKADLPNETIGVGDGFDFQLFDRALLYSADTRFVLAGIVNRMDRAYRRERKLRRNPADLPPDADRRMPRQPARMRLAAAADDAEHRAEGQGRSCDRPQRQADHLCRHRAAMARRRRICR